MIYVLAYPEFDKSLAVNIDRFRSSHEPERAQLVPPHITLVFGLKNVVRQDFLDLCEEVTRRASEIPLQFNRAEITYDPFDKAYKLFLLVSTGDQALTELHQQLYDGPHRTELNTEHPNVPHMTVATSEDRRSIAELDVREIGDFPISSKITSLEVVKHVGSRLDQLRTIPLGAKGALQSPIDVHLSSPANCKSTGNKS